MTSPDPIEQTPEQITESLKTGIVFDNVSYRRDVPRLIAMISTERARREEAEKERDTLRYNATINGACEVCWTNSWAPCKKDDPDGLEIITGPLKGDFAVCQMCLVDKFHRQLLAERADLTAQLRKLEQENADLLLKLKGDA